MKKSFLALVCLASLAWLTACTPEVKKFHLSEVLMTENDETICDQNGEPLTGEVWSDDDATFYMEVKNGQALYIKAFHENGQLAFLHEIAENEDGEDDIFTYYDEEGNEMSAEDFSSKYSSVMIRMSEAWPDTDLYDFEDLDEDIEDSEE